MTYEIYTQKELMDKVKPRHTGGYRLDLQVNNMRKTFYSTKKGGHRPPRLCEKGLSMD